MKKGYLLIFGIIICTIISFLLFVNNFIDYFIIFFAVTIVLIITFIFYIKNNRSPEDKFKSTLNCILKTFDDILISTNNLPKLDGKNIILVDSMQDLIDAQSEIKKPIYYKKTISSCSFVLLDTSEACIYTLRLNEGVQAPIDLVLDEIRINEKKLEEKCDKSILEDIERTTILKLENKKLYKISPISNRIDEIETL